MLLSLLGQPNPELDTGAEHGHTASTLTGSPEGLGTSATAAELSCIGAQTAHLQKRLAGHRYLHGKNNVMMVNR